MRIAAISDIHGNLAALDAVIQDIRKHSPDVVWCGGDIAWGAWPGDWANECIRIVRDSGWITVKGNTDIWITGDPQTIEDPDWRKSVEHTAALHNITPADARWLVSLPLGHSGPGSILLVHGTPDSPFTAPGPEDPPGDFSAYEGKAGVVVYGHIHTPFVRRLTDGTIVANMGSVGVPMDARTASYLIVDQAGPNWTITNRRVEFDTESAIDKARAADTPVADTFIGHLSG